MLSTFRSLLEHLLLSRPSLRYGQVQQYLTQLATSVAVTSNTMKVTYTSLHPVATWKWDTSSEPHYLWRIATDAPPGVQPLPSDLFKFGEVDDDDEDDDVCGICRLAFEACCPVCKVPGDDCPLSEYASGKMTDLTGACSLGRMQAYLSYALSFEMARDRVK